MSAAQEDRDYQPKPKVVEHPQLDESTGFDYRVHIKDVKTGNLIRIQNYTRHAKAGDVLLERPVGSGNCFYENGRPAGRYQFIQHKTDVEWKKISDDHIEVAPAPANREEALAQHNEMLEREIASLRAEVEKKQTQGTTAQKR
jgi:hypothetical protein